MNLKPFKDFIRFKKYQYLDFRKYNFKVKKNIEINNYLKKIETDGYAIIPDFLSNEKCNKIKNIINNFINTNPNLVWEDKINSDNRIFGAENISNEMKELIEHLVFFSKKVGTSYLNQKIELFMIMANRTYFKEENEGSGGGWHKDSYAKQFKSILYLNDVNEHNGPFQMIKKSNSNLFMLRLFSKLKNKFPSTRFSESEISEILLNKKDQIVELKATAGSLILVDTSYIHRGKSLFKNERFALTNYFFPESKFDDHKNHFKPKLDKLIK